jgi:DNA-binding helix-hairpin-helix protein with protein kinase domain
MKGFKTGTGKALNIGPRIGKGGEGEVRLLSGEPEHVLKLYTDGKAAARREKIEAMVAAGFHLKATNIAFPVNSAFDAKGAFVGFTMKKMMGFKPVHELYGPGSRKLEFPKANFPFLLRTSLNVARVVGSVHKTGCVIGDINHSGILVRPDATVCLIDSDSFQVRAAKKLFRCRVGVGEYTPPELQGQKLEDVDRTENHDAFGLAVLIFQLLFMGRHPFAGRFKGRDDMPIEKAICEQRFVYGARAARMSMEPPPGVPSLFETAPPAAQAFEDAFSEDASLRPNAARWVEILTRFEKELVVCRRMPGHHHHRDAMRCPWCFFEAETGIKLFPPASKTTQASAQTISLDRILAAMESVSPPPAPPDPATLVSKPGDVLPSAQALRVRRVSQIALIVVLVAITASAIMVWLRQWWPAAAAGGLALLAAAGLRGWSKLFASHRAAKAAWQSAAKSWQHEHGPLHFNERRETLKKLAEDYRHLPDVEQRNLATLNDHKRDIQRRAFLETFPVISADLKKIGESRRATLTSYGIGTTWDVTEQSLKAVPGFSGQTAKILLDWRRACESKFVFDPAKPVPRDAIKEVKDELLRLRLELEHSLRHARADLETLAHSLAVAQTKSTPALDAAFRRKQQAWADLRGKPHS